MARPHNKAELVSAAHTEYEKLKAFVSELDASQRAAEFSFEDRDRNVRDVIVHLIEWHLLLLRWVEKNIEEPQANVAFLPAPYNWKTYGGLNEVLRGRHQATPLDQALADLEESHREVLEVIEAFSDQELFTKKHFSWTGTTSLGSYCVSATSSHYAWALKKLKQHKKTLT